MQEIDLTMEHREPLRIAFLFSWVKIAAFRRKDNAFRAAVDKVAIPRRDSKMQGVVQCRLV